MLTAWPEEHKVGDLPRLGRPLQQAPIALHHDAYIGKIPRHVEIAQYDNPCLPLKMAKQSSILNPHLSRFSLAAQEVAAHSLTFPHPGLDNLQGMVQP